MTLKSYDWDGNLIHVFGGETYQYLDYIGGGYFAAMWRSGGFPNMDTYGIIKIKDGSVYTVKILSASLPILGTFNGGIVHDGHHFYVAREAKITKPSILYKRYIKKFDWKGNLIFNKEIDSTPFSGAPKSHCLGFDTYRLIYGFLGGNVKSIAIGSFDLGQNAWSLGVGTDTLGDICITEHRIITTHTDQVNNIKEAYIWNRLKPNKIIKHFDINYTTGIPAGVTTDGKVIYIGI